MRIKLIVATLGVLMLATTGRAQAHETHRVVPSGVAPRDEHDVSLTLGTVIQVYKTGSTVLKNPHISVREFRPTHALRTLLLKQWKSQ
jgi:hypothetical protein